MWKARIHLSVYTKDLSKDEIKRKMTEVCCNLCITFLILLCAIYKRAVNNSIGRVDAQK